VILNVRRYVREALTLARRAVTALEQVAGALEVIQLVVVEAVKEERRRAEEEERQAQLPPEPLRVDPPRYDT